MWRLTPNLSKTAKSVGRRPDIVIRHVRPCSSAQKSDSSKPAEPTPASAESSPSSLPPPQGKSGGVFWKLLGLSFVGAAGIVGYSWYDSDFRKKVQDNVPYTGRAFEYIFSYLPASPTSGEEIAPIGKWAPVTSLPQRNQVATSQVEDVMQAPSPSKSPVDPAESAEMTAEKQKRLEKEKIEETLRQKELEEATAHSELETRLKNLYAESVKYLEAAKASLSSAANIVKEHNLDMRRAVDESASEEQWRAFTGSRIYKPDSVWMSELDADRAKMALDKLRSAIEEGKANSVTARNSQLLSFEEELNKMNYALSSAVAQLNRAQSESKVIMEYHNVVRKSREQFHKELESVLPDAKITQRLTDGELAEDELNSLIAHAHRRIEQLQTQIVEHQKSEQQRLLAVLQQQKEENEKLTAEQLERERQLIKADLGVVQRKWEEELSVQLERELRSQLARQAAAHSEHLAEVLRIQKRELQAAFDVVLATRLDEERSVFQRYIVGWIGRMRGIDKALADRADVEKKARKAQEFWLACQTLQSIISNGREFHSGPKPLGPELAAITVAAPEDSTVLPAVVSSLPDVALSRGVWTEDNLVERFDRVREVARRVALVREGDSSLFRYALSYFLSFFVMRQPFDADTDADVAVDSLTPFALLDRAGASLERGNLEQAVRYVNQLTGEPRRVAADWLREARLLLETKQAADVLLAYAVAVSSSIVG